MIEILTGKGSKRAVLTALAAGIAVALLAASMRDMTMFAYGIAFFAGTISLLFAAQRSVERRAVRIPVRVQDERRR